MKKWISSWGFIPINFRFLPFTLENETQRVYMKNNVRGEEIRLRFSNRNGVTPLRLEQVTVGEADETNGWRTDRQTDVTFGGRAELVLAPGEECYSDAVPFCAKPGQWIAVSTYLRDRQQLNVSCTTNNTTMTFVQDAVGGNYCREGKLAACGTLRNPKVPGDIRDMMMYGLRQLDVRTEDSVKTIVVFGDSITHIGHWSGEMSRRLYERFPGQVSVINRGMGGNRLLNGEPDPANPKNKFGEAGVKRFVRDVFEQKELADLWEKNGGTASAADNPVDMAVIMEGINDINHAEDPEVAREERADSASMIKGLRQCIQLCHDRFVPVYLATLTPYFNFNQNWTESGEGLRQAYNYWIRFQNEADGFFDFDRSVRDEANPIAMRPLCDVGDHLHPSFEGGKRIAQEMDIDLLWEVLQRG